MLQNKPKPILNDIFGNRSPISEERTREGPIRTISLIPVHIKVPVESKAALYQKLAPKVKELKALGMSHRDIAVSLEIDKKTVGKALHAC